MCRPIPLFAYPLSERRLVSGLSLFELLVVLLLVALVFGFGLPFTTQWYQNQLSALMQKDIEQAVEQGIQESQILGEPLRLVPLRDKEWSTGLALIRETEVTADSQAVLYAWPWRNIDHHVIWHGFVSHAYLRFTPELSQSVLNGYFLIESPHQQDRKVFVNRIGRTRELSVR